MQEVVLAPASGCGVVVLVLASLTSPREFELAPLVVWLAGGAVVGGLLGWGAGIVFAPANAIIGFGLGFAIGGGLGAVSRLLTDEADAEPPESVTVSRSEERRVGKEC